MMAINSKVDWVDHTWNPWIGCNKDLKGPVVKYSEGCRLCFAEISFTRKPLWSNTWGPPSLTERKRTRTWGLLARMERMAKADGRKHTVFVMSLGDFFEDNPDVVEWRKEVCEIMEMYTETLIFLILTKRPWNVIKFMPDSWHMFWPPNVAIGTSVTSNLDAAAFLDPLLMINAPMHFVSVEPMLGPLSLEPWLDLDLDPFGPRLDWVIIGGESQKGCRPMQLGWPIKLIDQCDRYQVPAYMKQLGGHPKKRNMLYEWPRPLRLRQYPAYFGSAFKEMEIDYR